MSCMNFIGGNKAQHGAWSSLLSRSTHNDSIEIYYIFFEFYFIFYAL
jgi:hypothetical protein